MPRSARAAQGGYCFHVLNRGNGRRTVFRKEADYEAFVQLLREAGECTPIELSLRPRGRPRKVQHDESTAGLLD